MKILKFLLRSVIVTIYTLLAMAIFIVFTCLFYLPLDGIDRLERWAWKE